MRGAFLLLVCLWSATSAAQTMYKCTDARQRITYSNEVCEKQGLKDAGPVADRTTTMPFVPAQKSAPRGRDDADADRGAAQVKPIVPLLEKLSK